MALLVCVMAAVLPAASFAQGNSALLTAPNLASAMLALSPENLAAGRPASASSTESSSYTPARAVDGDSRTRWSSAHIEDEWWQVDLGAVHDIARVELDWELAYASRYRIRTSLDGTSFTTAAEEDGSPRATITTDFSPRPARYVRIEGLERGSMWGISFWEVRVFGPETPPADTTAPETTIDSGPSGPVTTDSASFAFSSSEAGSSFECRLDGGAWGPCTSPRAYSDLANGSHTFDVRATDAAGNTDPTPDSQTWTISPPADTTAPNTSISSGPAGTTGSASASFSFDSTEPGSSFQCRLDGGSWSACTSPRAYSGLANGSHTFEVRATDAAGNTDSTPASRTWIILLADTTPPDTTITSGPSGTVASASASFSFSSSDAGGTFQCRLDGGAWAGCTSPRTYSSLANGSHTFDVRAIDSAGNVDASPASRTWTVNVPPPEPPPGEDTISVQPGGNLSTAYNQAGSGDTLLLGCGSYGQWDTPAGSKTVTVRAQTRNCARFTRLHAKSSNITFDGLDIDAQGGEPMCPTSCAAYEVWGGNTNVTFKNGRIGNVGGQKGVFLHGTDTTAKQGAVIENSLIHDVRFTAAGQHLECIMSHSPGATFRGNTFHNCGYSAISLGRGDWWGQPEYGGVTIENNVFEHTLDGGAGGGWHWASMQWFLTTLEGARVVNNTFEQNLLMDRAVSGAGGVWANNIGGGWSCVPGVTYTGNVGKACSATDRAVSPTGSTWNLVAPFGWVNAPAGDFHLRAGSPAIDAGSATYAPARDKDGKARVGPPDAGAYEF